MIVSTKIPEVFKAVYFYTQVYSLNDSGWTFARGTRVEYFFDFFFFHLKMILTEN